MTTRECIPMAEQVNFCKSKQTTRAEIRLARHLKTLPRSLPTSWLRWSKVLIIPSIWRTKPSNKSASIGKRSWRVPSLIWLTNTSAWSCLQCTQETKIGMMTISLATTPKTKTPSSHSCQSRSSLMWRGAPGLARSSSWFWLGSNALSPSHSKSI